MTRRCAAGVGWVRGDRACAGVLGLWIGLPSLMSVG